MYMIHNLFLLSQILFINLISVSSLIFKTGICGVWLADDDNATFRITKTVLYSFDGHLPPTKHYHYHHGHDSNYPSHNIHHIIKTITVCAWPNSTFHSNVLHPFINLKVLEIEHSNFTTISQFKGLAKLEILNITWTNLEYVPQNTFSHLIKLRHLDLRFNKIRHMDSRIQLSKDLQRFYLADNPWNCSSNLKWMTNFQNYSIADANDLLCGDDKYFGRPVITVLSYKVQLKSLCNRKELKNCTCHISYLRPDHHKNGSKTFTPMYTVDCSNLGLTKLPTFLPTNTTNLYVTHNAITNIDTIRDNDQYEKVTDIYLDYNLIESIDALENSKWLNSFRIFSLRGNRIERILVYAMHDALQHNHHVGKLYLSENPWDCDCIFTAKLQELLMKYVTIIVDSKNITCIYEDDVYDVLTLKRTDLCSLSEEESFIQPLDILNIMLLSLIILILSKLAYDYYNYRHHGSLPWIVTKML